MEPDTATLPPPAEAESFATSNPFLADTESMFSQPEPQPGDPPQGQQPAATEVQPATADDDGDEPQPDAPKTGDDPAAGAMTPEKAAYIAEQKKSRTILRAERDAERARIAEIQRQSDERQQQRDLAEQRAKDLEEKLRERDELYRQAAMPKYDPDQDPDVGGVLKSVESAVAEFASELQQDSANKLSSEWNFIREAFEQARQARALRVFKDKLEEHFPGENADKIFEFVKAQAPKVREAEAKKVEKAAVFTQEVDRVYNERRRKATEYVSKFGEWTDEEIAKNPNDAQAIVTLLARTNPQVKEQIKALAPKYATLLAGNPPLPPTATPEALIQHRQNQRELESLQAAAPMFAFERPILASTILAQQQELELLRKRVGTATAAKDPGAKFTAEAEPKKVEASGYDAPNPYL